MCRTTLRIFELSESDLAADSNGVVPRHDEDDTVQFDQEEVIRRLKATFDGVEVGETDLLFDEARRVEALLSNHRAGDNPLVGSLYRKAESLGPAIRFKIPGGPEGDVGGSVRRYDITFRYGRDTPAGARAKIREFLESFAVGTVDERPCKE